MKAAVPLSLFLLCGCAGHDADALTGIRPLELEPLDAKPLHIEPFEPKPLPLHPEKPPRP